MKERIEDSCVSVLEGRQLDPALCLFQLGGSVADALMLDPSTTSLAAESHLKLGKVSGLEISNASHNCNLNGTCAKICMVHAVVDAQVRGKFQSCSM